MTASGSYYSSHSRDNSGLVIAALGIVFGDIGTSPLYTLKECFAGVNALPATPENITGILSLVFWSILIVISLKYVVFIMRADNRGEGGIMALMSLVGHKAKISPITRSGLMVLGLIGASLFYGDGVITPAISVLSAVEGLEILRPTLHPYIVPIALAVLITLFGAQRHGTRKVGGLFGPIMVVWFVSLAGFGLTSLLETPEIMNAVNPRHAVEFFGRNGWLGSLTLGAVVLAVTGGEALYADMGHFGRTPIRKAWFWVALPALLLNYFGQGALLIRDPAAIQNPFYLLVPPGALTYMITVATLATVIASQAVISGAFSLTSQAIQLGFCPRLMIRYTSDEEMGQIYVPAVNLALMVGVIGLIVTMESSTRLAAAYGIAVTGTMAIDTILAFVVVYSLWKWNPVLSGIVALGFLTVDLAFFGANVPKIPDGGWFPLIIASAIFLLLSTWKRGRDLLQHRLQEEAMPVADFVAEIEQSRPVRVPGTAVFLASSRQGIPLALLNNLKHNKVMHENVVMMTVITEPLPRVASDKRRTVQKVADSLFRVNLHYGFAESPNIPRALKSSSREFDISPTETNFFLSRETLIAKASPRMALWRIKLFIIMARNAGSAANYFHIPANHVIELGAQVIL
jgi:KUP system potassium uptake protein